MANPHLLLGLQEALNLHGQAVEVAHLLPHDPQEASGQCRRVVAPAAIVQVPGACQVEAEHTGGIHVLDRWDREVPVLPQQEDFLS